MLIKKDPDVISAYLKDYSNLKGGSCVSVFFPENEKEVSELLSSASRQGMPITVSGAGTGVTGARVPFNGSVLSTEKMNRILDIKVTPNGGEVRVEPGVLLNDLLDAVSSNGLFYPPDPTEKSSFIGGNIATSASGARSFKHGSTRDYVLGLKVVLSSGETVRLERGDLFSDEDRAMELKLVSGETLKLDLPKYTVPRVKNAAGYYIKDNVDAIDLFIGQEGTLGIITEARLRLLKKPDDVLECYCFFDKLKDALLFAYKARDISRKNITQAGSVNAASIEFFNGSALRFLREKHKKIPESAQGAIYFSQEVRKDTESKILDAWAGLITECGGSVDNTWFAQSRQEREELAGIRHDLPDMVNEFINRHNMTKIGTDIAVDAPYIDSMISYYNTVLTEAGFSYVMFGHIGDGHLHVNILPKDDKEYMAGHKIYEQFVKKAISFNGTISAEHGIGKIKHEYLKMMYGEKAIREMAALKKTLDPACILGLDNIFPKELLEA
ncbi:MAG: FAD-binding oxidoreductase [Candidatus Omnitrophota bacterium]